MRRAILAVTVFLATCLFAFNSDARAAASNLTVDQSCSGGRANVTFRWTGNDFAANQQWIDLSIFNNGWLQGSFLSAGPLNASAGLHTWRMLLPNTQHFVRINQQLADGTWEPSQTFSFSTRCEESPPLSCSRDQIADASGSQCVAFPAGQLVLAIVGDTGPRRCIDAPPIPSGQIVAVDYSYPASGCIEMSSGNIVICNFLVDATGNLWSCAWDPYGWTCHVFRRSMASP